MLPTRRKNNRLFGEHKKYHMNKVLLYILGLLLTVSCVDDYTDANPAHLLDAPFLRVSGNGSNQIVQTVPVNAYQNNYRAYAQYGGAVEFTVSVVDAPGRVASVSVVPSVPDFGTVALNESTVSSLVGQEKGEFKFTFTPNPALPDASDRSMNLVISVSDSQLNEVGESAAKTTILTLPTNLVSCLSTGIEDGTYVVTEASGNLDGGDPFTLDDLLTDAGVDAITVSLEQARPGLYTMDEVTGGVWPVYYSGRANPALKVDLCGNTILGHEGDVTAGSEPGPLRKFDIAGTVNENGTITITWSYERLDAGTPDSPASGTYTLSKL